MSRLPRSTKYQRNSAGFTMLEVMIAVAIMATALTVLYGSQSKSLSVATEAHFNIIAPSLAAAKLAEIESQTIELTSDSGEFGDDFPGYTWELEVEDAALDEIEALGELEEPLQKVDLRVGWNGSPYSYSLRYYVYIVSSE